MTNLAMPQAVFSFVFFDYFFTILLLTSLWEPNVKIHLKVKTIVP